jgi:hypothetical protein
MGSIKNRVEHGPTTGIGHSGRLAIETADRFEGCATRALRRSGIRLSGVIAR